MRGRPPAPSPILKARGSRWAKDRAGEATLPVERPDCPDWLEPEGRAEWGRVCGELERVGLITRSDRAALALWCEAWQEYVEAVDVIKHGERDGAGKVILGDDGKPLNRGHVVVGSKGNPVVSPWVRIRNAAGERLLALAARFGLAPVDRVRLRITSAADPDQDGGKGRYFFNDGQ